MKNIIFIISIVIFFTDSLIAETSEEKGLSIAKKSYESTRGFVDSQSDQLMILIDPKGNEVTREISGKTYENTDVNDGDKSIIFFNKPKDVEGTVLLSHTHVNDDDDQWLYLPALKRVKRIASKNKSGPFLGSEFSFEDFSFQEVEKYEYQYIRDEEYEGMLCHVIERIPLDPYSGYTKQIVWIDTEYFLIRKIHHFDRKSFHLKTQLFLDYEIYDEAYWQPHRVVMNNNQNGKSSILSFKDVKYKNGLTDRDFSQNSLKRSR